ncbi:MAG: hypothetical protein ABJA66_20725, partial [Actinomycetota bacterium]
YFVNSTVTSKNEFPNIFRKIKNGFKKLFGIKTYSVDYVYPSYIKDVILSQNEILTICPLPKKTRYVCPNNRQSIEISTTVENIGTNVITYSYKVSSGKIIGNGENVIWDLSGVEPGTYTISGFIDYSCGNCGKTITKEVKVVECPDCK